MTEDCGQMASTMISGSSTCIPSEIYGEISRHMSESTLTKYSMISKEFIRFRTTKIATLRVCQTELGIYLNEDRGLSISLLGVDYLERKIYLATCVDELEKLKKY